jgi:hypothetical protein
MPYRPDFWPNEKGTSGPLGVLDMCLDLHMDANGSSDCLDPKDREVYIKCLQWLLKDRNPALSQHKFDRRVADLVLQTLSECKAYPEELKERDRVIYTVSVPIGDEGPDGQRQEILFHFDAPPSRDDIMRAATAHAETWLPKADIFKEPAAYRKERDRYEKMRGEMGSALMDFFKFHDEYPKSEMYYKDTVVRIHDKCQSSSSFSF